MKKILTLNKILIAAAVVLTACTVTVLFTTDGLLFKTTADNPEPERYGKTLEVGRYMHTSGDETKFVEVYDDQTIQVFGYDGLYESLNMPENKESNDRLFANLDVEFVDGSWTAEISAVGRNDMRQASQSLSVFYQLREYYDLFNQRHAYVIDSFLGDSVHFVDTSTGLFTDDDLRTLILNDDNVYRFAG